MSESRSWTQVVEEDLDNAERQRFLQWAREHPHPLDSLRESLRQATAETEALRKYIEDHGCDCLLPEEQESPVTNMYQHCTSADCPFTYSHTAQHCGYEQPRRCGCSFCY